VIFINWWQFLFQLLIAGFVLRYAQVKLAGTDFGKALAFIY
jgi:hypothetical protein